MALLPSSGFLPGPWLLGGGAPSGMTTQDHLPTFAFIVPRSTAATITTRSTGLTIRSRTSTIKIQKKRRDG